MGESRKEIRNIELVEVDTHHRRERERRPGDTCEVDSACRNGGLCNEVVIHTRSADGNGTIVHTEKHCHCSKGYGGTMCTSFCPLACQNHGQCQHHLMVEPTTEEYIDQNPDNFFCKCFGHFTGETCDIPYTNCGDGRRCYNGGECLHNPRTGISKCKCPAGFDGDTCEGTYEGIRLKKFIHTSSGHAVLGMVAVLMVIIGFFLVLYCSRKQSKKRKNISIAKNRTRKSDLTQHNPESIYGVVLQKGELGESWRNYV